MPHEMNPLTSTADKIIYIFSDLGQMSLENNTRYREQSIRLLFLVVPFAVLFFNIIWLAFDWPGIIKVRVQL